MKSMDFNFNFCKALGENDSSPCSNDSKQANDEVFNMETSLTRHLDLLGMQLTQSKSQKLLEEIRTTPLFSPLAYSAAKSLCPPGEGAPVLPAFGLLAGRLDMKSTQKVKDANDNDPFRSLIAKPSKAEGTQSKAPDPRIFLNVNAPWSAFICGSQGSGKSHSLSCMLENCFILDSRTGVLPEPLAGILFHYDTFNSDVGGHPCEAAYLASAGVKVRVLVAASNESRLRRVYRDVHPDIDVQALLIDEEYLDVETLLTLMAADPGDGSPQPLYMQTVLQVLRSISKSRGDTVGIPYARFKSEIMSKQLTPQQTGPLELRLALLEDFISYGPTEGFTAWNPTGKQAKTKTKIQQRRVEWKLKPGQLTIVDLSCPFVDAATACGLFDICLRTFLSRTMDVGRLVALDEAHKFMNKSGASAKLTERLMSAIRLQRHLACRIIVATQEPTIESRLLDLCSITLIHRFTSPQWYKTLKGHLAAVAENDVNKSKEGARTQVEDEEADSEDEGDTLFGEIARLEVGEALLCAPTAILGAASSKGKQNEPKIEKLGTRYLKVRIRERISADGGQSVLVTR